MSTAITSLVKWVATELPGCIMYANEVLPEYEIKLANNGKYYVVRVVAECDDIGPLNDFAAAEDVVIHLGALLIEFEEQAWRQVAARALQKAGLITLMPAPQDPQMEIEFADKEAEHGAVSQVN